MSWKKRNYTAPEKTFIYALKDPSGEVRYVGKSDDPQGRYTAHLSRARSLMRATMAPHFCPSRKETWLMHLLDNGHEPELVILEECDFEVWFKREEYWRDQFLGLGHRLTNRKRNKGKGNLNDDYYEKSRAQAWKRYRSGGPSWTWESWKEPS